MIEVQHSVSLADLTTMGVGGTAHALCVATTTQDIQNAIQYARDRKLPFWVLGEGSNTIAKDAGYEGLVVQPSIRGIETVQDTIDSTTLRVGCGENWSDFVDYTVEQNLQGIEAMTLIPGTVGAAPVQNIGAYGQEVSETITTVEAYDTTTDTFVTLSNDECGFSYRHSIFRGEQMGRYVICYVTFSLHKARPSGPFYKAIEEYARTHAAPLETVADVRNVVAAIRIDKLPDPNTTPNSGSFFKNAIISSEHFEVIKTTHPDAPHYLLPDGRVKVPSGWLIQQCGLKGVSDGGMAVHDKNALVVKNIGTTSYRDLAAMRQRIVDTVRDTFDIILEQEPLEIS